MFKTLLYTALLGLVMIATAGVSRADGPTPDCWPCVDQALSK
jgi:hypothetical protein